MVLRLRRLLDVRSGEGLPLLLAFLYITLVVAAFTLAKIVRNSFFLEEYGPYALVYVYAAVPVVVSLFVPLYGRIAARIGLRAVTVATLAFFSGNVLLFWYAFARHPFGWLPAVFYVWVNCFAAIAPVQAWSFANSLFDTRQAKRLFVLLGVGASLGSIGSGVLARVLVGRLGGTVNMLGLLAILITMAALVVVVANARIHRRGAARRRTPSEPLGRTLRTAARSPYIRLIAALVVLTAVATQWTGFQLSVVAAERFGTGPDSRDAYTAFFGTFNVAMGLVSVLVQLLVTAPALRRYGVAVTIMVLPLSLWTGSGLIFLFQGFWPVLFTSGCEQGLRFSMDKASYELLYLPIPARLRVPVKNAIDIVISRTADALGAVLLGATTQGFAMLPGLQFGLKGTAAINLVVISAWIAAAWRLRREYVRAIHEDIHLHRLQTQRASETMLDRAAADALAVKLSAADPSEVRYALSFLEAHPPKEAHIALRNLLWRNEPDIRRRALAMLSAAGDRSVSVRATDLLSDPDLGVRTEALLYVTRVNRLDPLRQLKAIGQFEDVSVRAGLAAFLAAPGPSQNLEAARFILTGMAEASGGEGPRERAEAARVLGLAPEQFPDLLAALVADEELGVSRQAIRSVGSASHPRLVEAVFQALRREELGDEAVVALSCMGDPIVPRIEGWLDDPAVPLEVKRELPSVLLLIGTPRAEEALVAAMLHSDVTLRHRAIVTLNKVRAQSAAPLPGQLVELLLAAEIAGHYRSYQVLVSLEDQLEPDDASLAALRQGMRLELERIFRLLALMVPGTGIHDAHYAVTADNPAVRANALEFLENVLAPGIRQLVLPLVDPHVSPEDRRRIADHLLGIPVETPQQAVQTLLASTDAWLRSCAVYAIGALHLQGFERELEQHERTDPALRDAIQATRQRLAQEADADAAEVASVPAAMEPGVGAG